MKRLLSLFLVVMMCGGLLPVRSFADDIILSESEPLEAATDINSADASATAQDKHFEDADSNFKEEPVFDDAFDLIEEDGGDFTDRNDSIEQGSYYEYPVPVVTPAPAPAPTPVPTAAPSSGICGDNLTWVLDEEGVLTISGTGTMTDYSRTAPVSSSGGPVAYNSSDMISSAPWGARAENITSVVIESGVTSIGDYAFYKCANLQSAEIPESVVSIGICAFSRCASLPEITVPASVKSVGAASFALCNDLASVNVKGGSVDVGQGAFYSCESLKSVSFTTASFPGSNSVIQDHAFYNCSSLRSITLPGNLSSIGDFAFSSCFELAEIVFPASLKSLGAGTFNACYSLEDVNLPEGLTSIGEWCFRLNLALTAVTLPASLADLDPTAFYACHDLTVIDVAEGNPYYISEDGVVFNKDMTELIMYPSGKTGDYEIPAGVTTIGADAFADGLDSITTLTIPESVTKIGSCAFSFRVIEDYGIRELTQLIGGTSNGHTAYSFAYFLERIIFRGNAPEMDETCFNGVHSIAIYPSNNETWTQEVMNSVYSGITWMTESEYNAEEGDFGDGFHWMIQNGVLTITGTGAMDNYEFTKAAPWVRHKNAVTAVEIADGITNIGDYTFLECANLKSIMIPVSVTHIGYCTFGNENVPQIVYYGGSEADWNAITTSIQDYTDYVPGDTVQWKEVLLIGQEDGNPANNAIMSGNGALSRYSAIYYNSATLDMDNDGSVSSNDAAIFLGRDDSFNAARTLRSAVGLD